MPYFDAPLPHRLAHRGATDGGRLDENTLPAFELALDQGATHIETDVRVSADGIAVVFHDADFDRVGSQSGVRGELIERLTIEQIRSVELRAGGRVSSLLEVLIALPSARFNIDVKSMAAATATARAVIEADAADRVLISSFSDSRRLATLAEFERSGVALPAAGAGARTSAIALMGYWVARALGRAVARRAVARLLMGVDALQVPVRFGPLKVASRGFIAAVRAARVHVHFWVINDAATARSLLERGASGIVSDDLPAIR